MDSTEKRALALILKTGGRVEGDRITVKTEPPKAPKLEVWDDYGSPVERIPVSDPRWKFTGEWKASGRAAKISAAKGASA